jgi:hypothetical protein
MLVLPVIRQSSMLTYLCGPTTKPWLIFENVWTFKADGAILGAIFGEIWAISGNLVPQHTAGWTPG